MANRKASVALAAVMAGLLVTPALAQSSASDEHHPASEATSGATTQGGAPMMGQGMMGPGMMGQGMMRQGMMGPAMMGQGGRGWGMMGARHVEGRIAFLKAELKITAAQQKRWDAVADAMRANAKDMTAMRGSMAAVGAATNLPDRLAAREKLLSARLDALRRYKAAIDPFYAVLSDAQKKTADELMPGMMGMGMGGGMMGRLGMR